MWLALPLQLIQVLYTFESVKTDLELFTLCIDLRVYILASGMVQKSNYEWINEINSSSVLDLQLWGWGWGNNLCLPCFCA